MSLPRALDGIRVVDFSWVRAGPWATRWLGAPGAEIIKIEWPENERGRLPSSTTPQNVEVNLNTSGNFNDTNVNKRSLSLNVRTPKGLEVVKRLIAISDIVIENFSSRVLRNWGLGYEELCKVKPDIVYVSMSGYGHTGRNHHYTTFGPVAQAVSGLTFISGLPDDNESIAIVRAVAGLAANLNMTVTAEGVETAEQLETIRALGCVEMQGYLFSRPVPLSQIMLLLEPQRRKLAKSA